MAVKRTREAKLVEAIDLYESARAKFVDLAADSAEFEGDSDFEKLFNDETAKFRRAERNLWSFLSGRLPIVHKSCVYTAGAVDAVITRVQVQLLV